ncbi:MAG: GrdX family protein [Pseudoleptotrichia goodfellowii]|nr:GrdX family protein [Pseudoleptotrichia goodfellowii]
MKLITNNPNFLNYKKKDIEVDYRDVDYLKILEIARDYTHVNYELLTHPLYGSVKPNETIYRSIVLKSNDNLDHNSVVMISEAIETFVKFRKNKETPLWTDTVKEDFGVIDYDLITNAIERIIK